MGNLQHTDRARVEEAYALDTCPHCGAPAHVMGLTQVVAVSDVTLDKETLREQRMWEYEQMQRQACPTALEAIPPQPAGDGVWVLVESVGERVWKKIEFSFVTAAVHVLLTAVLKHEGPDGFAEWVRRVTQLVIDHADPLHTETHAGPDGKGH